MILIRAKFFAKSLLPCFAFFLVLVSSNTHATHFVPVPEEIPWVFKTDPSFSIRRHNTEKMISKISCAGIHNGERLPCSIDSTIVGFLKSQGIARFEINNMITGIPLLNCNAVTDNNITVEELFIFGGYLENKDSRDLTYKQSPYLLDGKSTNSIFKTVEGETKNPSELVYKTPQEAGILSIFTELTAPENPVPGYSFVFRSGSTVEFHVERHIVGLRLGRLDGCVNEGVIAGKNYTLARTPADLPVHPEANWTQRRTIFVANDLANLVFKRQVIRMSYNDGGLPMGGHHRPHTTHRTGKDIDINADAMDYDCNDTAKNARRYIRDAFIDLYGDESVVEGTTTHYPNIDCYRTKSDGAFGYMHIDAIAGF